MIYVLIVIAVCVLFYVLKGYRNSRLMDRCTGTVTGHYLYSEWKGKISGSRVVEGCWNPVCEYSVDNIVYMVELEVLAPNDRFEVDAVEVKYLPSDPGVCFVDGTRGKLLSTHRNTEG